MHDTHFTIYLVEDDPWYGQILQHYLELNPDYEVALFTTGRQLLDQLHRKPDLICMDYGLPDIGGEALLQEIHTRDNTLPVIVISAQEEISVAVDLLKAGVKDYIVKNDHTSEHLWKSVIQIRENLHLRQEVETLKAQLGQKYRFERSIIGQSEALKQTFPLLQKAIATNINVSLSGETGTGKEVFAKAIHFNSERKKKPFVAINMSAIPRELAESELFGHEKGAFTGANGAKLGKFEEAHGGTLFLDEIGELDLALQSKLLRVIQEREVVRLGGNKSYKVDIRLITATHKNLSDEVMEGRFREDLFFRIVGLPIELPPLRHRGQDVILLAKHFITEFAQANPLPARRLSGDAKAKLRKYAWPGNVRELKAVIELACVMAEGPEISAEDLTFYEIGLNKAYSETEKTLKAYEIEIITHFLLKYNRNVSLVAEKLDIGKSKIYNMLKLGELQLH